LSILDSIPSIVKSAASQLLFSDATAVSYGAATSDGRGGYTHEQTTEVVRALVLDTDETLANANTTVSGPDKEIIILLDGVTVPIEPSTVLILGDGTAYKLRSITRDPAGATITAQAQLTVYAPEAGLGKVVLRGGAKIRTRSNHNIILRA
jgi:hypothetical protein